MTTKFNVGDKVKVINGYGFTLKGLRTITKIEVVDGKPRYYIYPTDTPWYSHPEDRIRKVETSESLFIGIFATGISYADKSKTEHGDYKKIAFLTFSHLELTVYDPFSGLLDTVKEDAKKIQSRVGEDYQTSSSGQTNELGYALRH